MSIFSAAGLMFLHVGHSLHAYLINKETVLSCSVSNVTHNSYVLDKVGAGWHLFDRSVIRGVNHQLRILLGNKYLFLYFRVAYKYKWLWYTVTTSNVK